MLPSCVCVTCGRDPARARLCSAQSPGPLPIRSDAVLGDTPPHGGDCLGWRREGHFETARFSLSGRNWERILRKTVWSI